jgi:hypothetical protein
MAFVPENRLEEALARAATDVLARPLFYQLLMSEPLVVAGEIVRKSPDGPAEGMNLAIIRHNGRMFHPIFTSLGRIKAVAPDEKRHFAMLGRDFFLRTKGANFLLNPNSELSRALLPGEIAFWLDPSARARRTLTQNPPHAKLAVFDEPPRILTEALRILFANRRDVVSAHVLEVAFSDRDEPAHPLIVIAADAHFEKLTTEVSELSAAVLPDLIIDLVPHDPRNPDPALVPYLAQTRAFYQRQSTE